jgi:hypothetical protein
MLVAEYSRRRKLDGFNLFVRVSDQDANVNHYNTIFLKAFTDKNFSFNGDENEFMFYEMQGNLLYKYLYILNKFVLKCDKNEMNEYKQTMKALCQKRLVKVDYRIFTRDSFTQDYTEDDIPQEILDEFSYLFTHIKQAEVEEEAEEEEVEQEAEVEAEEEVEQEEQVEEEEQEIDNEFEAAKEQFEVEQAEFQATKEQFEMEQAEFQSTKEQFEAEQAEFQTAKEQLEMEQDEFNKAKEQFEAEQAAKEQFETDEQDAKYNEMQREIEMLRQKLEFFSNNATDENNELQTEYNNLLAEFEDYKETTEKQIEELKQYEPVDLSLYTKTDTSEIATLFKEFEDKIENLITNNKDSSVDMHRLRNTITSLEMENTELRRENEEIYEKLSYCEKQFEVIKQKYVKLQQLKHKYKTMVINSSSTNHIEELPFISKKRFSPIPDEPVRYPYKMN